MILSRLYKYYRNNKQLILVIIEYFLIALLIGFLLLIAYMIQNPS